MIWLLILGTWEGAYRLVHWRPWIFPAPSMIVDSLLGMLNIDTSFGAPLSTPGWPLPRQGPDAGAAPASRESHWYDSPLILANVVSLVRLAVGFSLSLIVGGLIGLMMWRWGALDQFLGPPLLGVQTLPSVCWVPMAILLLGLSEKGILFVMVMGSFAAVAISMRDGLRMIPPLFPRAGLMLGARGWRLYRYVLLPASLPALATSLRQGFSFAWRSLMGAELILVVAGRYHRGLGFLLQTGRDTSDISQVIAVMIVMVVIGMLADRWVFARIQSGVQARFGLE
jgi:NitT/TauT family transport system permease protein